MNKMSIVSATQLNKILSFLLEETKEKIPKDIWKEIKDKTDNNLNTKINGVKDITEENVLPETRKYLSFIFLKYLATEEEKEEYMKIIRNNEEQYQKVFNQKYMVDNIFNKKETSIKEEREYIEARRNLLVEYKEGFFTFIFNKIKKLFGA
ncbi:MAG: hypothetical protein HFJ33_05600 [Clostridia bacterium]|nr:hypothetical protein [Clostridia bacterium]